MLKHAKEVGAFDTMHVNDDNIAEAGDSRPWSYCIYG